MLEGEQKTEQRTTKKEAGEAQRSERNVRSARRFLREKREKQGLGRREKLWAEAKTGRHPTPSWNKICEFFYHVECRTFCVCVPPILSLPPSFPQCTIFQSRVLSKVSKGIFSQTLCRYALPSLPSLLRLFLSTTDTGITTNTKRQENNFGQAKQKHTAKKRTHFFASIVTSISWLLSLNSVLQFFAQRCTDFSILLARFSICSCKPA